MKIQSKTIKLKKQTNLNSSRKYKNKSIKSITKLQQKPTTKPIKIISYNLSWESMTGKEPNWVLCSNNTDPLNPRHNSVCVSNIATVLEDNLADFILLQEADNYNNLLEESHRLKQMGYEFHESDMDKMVTFWNKKYKPVKIIRDEFEKGRPWMAILYTNGWCVVNVHFGHYTREEEIMKLNQLVRKIKKEVNKSQSGGYKRIIIGGDFNHNIKKLGQDGKMLLDDVIFYYHPKHILTCCINRNVHYDHVIDTQSPLLDITIPPVAYMASDHKPILATLE
jgi:endonuclease/exonuclease/phosphatase family metal-dependent hydrolase